MPKTISLEKSQKYYWKIRVSQAATGEKGDGDWSKVMSFSVASPPSEETSQPSPASASPPNGAKEETKPSSWIVNLSLWIWIMIALLLVAIPIAAFTISRTKR
jgi:hypothetical protein